MSTVSANAPGKLVLVGEYVVLDGAPAIGVAVNARANVSISATEGDKHVLACPGFADGEYRFSVSEDGVFLWEGGAPDLALLENVWTASRMPRQSLRLVLDTSRFHDQKSGLKYGLGSSAALTTALVAALRGDAKLQQLVQLHRAFQSGRGSGIDVAVACCGGVIAYRMQDCSVQQLAWPGDLQFAVLWSGVRSSTTNQIATFNQSTVKVPSRQALADASEKIAAQWPGSNSRTLLASLATYTDLLAHFDQDYSLGIFEAGHEELRRRAVEAGVVYKPCGAGGGDVGIVLSHDQRLLENFADVAARLGFTPLDLAIDDVGISVS